MYLSHHIICFCLLLVSGPSNNVVNMFAIVMVNLVNNMSKMQLKRVFLVFNPSYEHILTVPYNNIISERYTLNISNLNVLVFKKETH